MAEARAAPSEGRTSRPSHREREFWSARRVAWYQRALARSDYAPRIIGTIEPLLAGVRSVLDVGAGCGALALPLAERGLIVTALEPAPAMAAALRMEAAWRRLSKLTVLDGAWGAVAVPPHDAVLCAHVGELTRPGAPFLAEVARWARRWVVIVRDRSAESDKLFFQDLYPAFLGRPYGGGSDYRDMLGGLADLGIRPGILEVDYRSDQPFIDLEEACDFYEVYLNISGVATREALRAFLAPRLVREGPGWIAPYTKHAVVLWWCGTAD